MEDLEKALLSEHLSLEGSEQDKGLVESHLEWMPDFTRVENNGAAANIKQMIRNLLLNPEHCGSTTPEGRTKLIDYYHAQFGELD